jgi:heme exporter protein D
VSALQTFLEMGGYAAFVWPSYLLSLLVLGVVLIASVRARRRSEQLLAALRDRSARVRRHAS